MNDRQDDARFTARRLEMVDEQLLRRDIRDPAVLAAMRTVPRHLFVPSDEIAEAYSDGPLAIGHGQTISQPYVVASMTQALGLPRDSRVLEIGTGSGYQTAVLAELFREVYSVEIVPDLLVKAERILRELGYTNAHTLPGDGALGWPEHSPYDGILVTAAAPHIPPLLLDQLAVGGRLVIPLIASDAHQELRVVTKTPEGDLERYLYDVRFVLMRGSIESNP